MCKHQNRKNKVVFALKEWIRPICIVITFAFIIHFCYLVNYYCFLRQPESIVFNQILDIFYILLFLCVFGGIFFLIVALVKKRINFIFIFCFICYLICFITVPLSDYLKNSYYFKSSKKAAPVIIAIENYIEKNGRHPSEFQDLIPNYISQTNLSNIIGELNLKLNTKDERFNNSWTLEIPMPRMEGEYQSTMLIYYPKKNYPFKEYENDGWAIVHYK